MKSVPDKDFKRIGGYFDDRIDNLCRQQLTDCFTGLLESCSWSVVKLDLLLLLGKRMWVSGAQGIQKASKAAAMTALLGCSLSIPA